MFQTITSSFILVLAIKQHSDADDNCEALCAENNQL